MIGANEYRNIYNKLIKLCANGNPPHCPVCNREIGIDDSYDIEYIKVRGTEKFIHTKCIREAWNE